MPDLGRLNSETLTLTRSPNSLLKPTDSPPTLAQTLTPLTRPDYPPKPDIMTIRVSSDTRISSGFSIDGAKKILEDFITEWKCRRVDSGVSENRCYLPFLVGDPSLVECRVCSRYIFPGSEVSCSVRGCQRMYHMNCAREMLKYSALKKFKCPHHACFLCKQKPLWRCVRCDIAAHDKCAAFPDDVIQLKDQPSLAVCWRHPEDWRQEQHPALTTNFEDVFARLPLPYVEEEFEIDLTVKDCPHDRLDPPPYVHIRRNIYLVKKKRDDACVDIGCTSCSSTSTCSKDCLCRVQSISCSRACRCSEACTNRPFRKDKKMKVVKTDLCGWGVVAAESINKGDFVIEYVGEVIGDVECTQRLWAMKNKDVKNFYMCEIKKDFTIDATVKGNASRFLNHSCDPNCQMEKWQVEGETRVGVFASRSIEAGEFLTYDYRFVQFGHEVKCHCGAANCQGFLGAKKKVHLDSVDMKRKMHLAGLSWGSKRRRAFASQLVGALQPHLQ